MDVWAPLAKLVVGRDGQVRTALICLVALLLAIYVYRAPGLISFVAAIPVSEDWHQTIVFSGCALASIIGLRLAELLSVSAWRESAGVRQRWKIWRDTKKMTYQQRRFLRPFIDLGSPMLTGEQLRNAYETNSAEIDQQTFDEFNIARNSLRNQGYLNGVALGQDKREAEYFLPAIVYDALCSKPSLVSSSADRRKVPRHFDKALATIPPPKSSAAKRKAQKD